MQYRTLQAVEVDLIEKVLSTLQRNNFASECSIDTQIVRGIDRGLDVEGRG